MIQNGPRRSRVALHKDRVQGFECFWLREPLTQHRGKTAVPYFVGPKYRVLTRCQLPDACSVKRCPYVPGYRQCPSMDCAPKDKPGYRNGTRDESPHCIPPMTNLRFAPEI
jgi:hypothetical protein